VIFITGGLGYLGARISESLCKAGELVRIGSSRKEIRLPYTLNNCEIVHTNFFQDDSLKEACKDVKTVIHLASMNAQDCENNPEQAKMLNGYGTLNLINAARNEGIKKFIYFSSIHVYGNKLTGEINEDSLTRPNHPYATTRLVAENFVRKINNDNSCMQSLILRLSNTIGRPLSKETNIWMLVAHDLCRQSVIQRKLVLHGNGQQQRDFMSITDLLRLVKLIVKKDDFRYDLMNVGKGNSVPIIQIAKMISIGCNKLFGYKPPIIVSNNSELIKTSKSLHYNCERLDSFGFKHSTQLEDEIIDLLLFCKKEFTDE
jgi:UDP-glucose 4-epimerase